MSQTKSRQGEIDLDTLVDTLRNCPINYNALRGGRSGGGKIRSVFERIRVKTYGDLIDKMQEEDGCGRGLRGFVQRYKGLGDVYQGMLAHHLTGIGLSSEIDEADSQQTQVPVTEIVGNLSVRARNLLQRWNVKTLEELTKLTPSDMLKDRKCAPMFVEEFRKLLAQHNLYLKGEKPVSYSSQ